MEKEIAIYQTEDGALELITDNRSETVWATVKQIAALYNIDRSVASRHIKNILKSGELDEKVVCAKFAHTTQHGAIESKTQTHLLDYYNLDVILAVGYRTNSQKAMKFRQWATQRLKEYLIKGYTINQKVLKQNHQLFLQAMEDLKHLTQNNSLLEVKDVLSLVQSFSTTFFVLDKYDRNEFPKEGTLLTVQTNARELMNDLQQLKKQLIQKGEASELFAQEKQPGNLQGIFGNVFQTVFGQDAYPAIEDKAAHLLYFIVKNHPFNDGNKRCGAFSFIWLLQKAGYPFQDKISPETLTTLTLLIAESNPSDKEKMIGIIKLLLNPNFKESKTKN